MILKEYNLSVRLPQEKAIDTGITLVQNDKGVYKLNVRIFDGVNEIDYTDVTSATITFSKADGNVVQGDMTVGANALTYTMGTNEIAHPGSVLASVQLFGADGERLTSTRFRFYVVKDLITPSAVQSTSEFPILQRIADDVSDIVPLIPEIEDTIQKMPEITQFFDTAEASESQRVQNETTRQTQEAARQASIADIEDRFDNLTASQQQDAEVIDARRSMEYGQFSSLRARLDHADVEQGILEAQVSSYRQEFNEHKAEIVPHAETVARTITVGAGKDFTTIQAAIDSIKKKLDATITISVDAGVYHENVYIKGFEGGGALIISGGADIEDANNYSIISLRALNNTASITFTGFTATTSTYRAFMIEECNNFSISLCRAEMASSTYPGFYISRGNAAVAGCMASNRSAALQTGWGAIVFSSSWEGGTNNIRGIYCRSASTVGKYGTQPSGTTLEQADQGGAIR